MLSTVWLDLTRMGSMRRSRPMECDGCGLNCDASCSLRGQEVSDRGAVVNVAETSSEATVVEHTLRRGCFAGINVRNDANIPCLCQSRIVTGQSSPTPSLASKLSMARLAGMKSQSTLCSTQPFCAEQRRHTPALCSVPATQLRKKRTMPLAGKKGCTKT